MTNEAKGPYELSENDIGRYVIGDLPQHLAAFESYAEACIAVGIANAAHSQALTSQAARLKELEEALTHIVEYWNRSENDRAMSDALYHMIETAEATLTPKEAT